MIRPATPSDCQAIWQLICTLEETQLPLDAFTRIYAQQRADGRHVTLVWESDNTVAAVMNMRIEGQLHHAAQVAEIQELVVDPALRGKRVGAQLFAAAREAARQAGCVRIELVTNQRRHDAHRFYEREGMTQSHFGYTLNL